MSTRGRLRLATRGSDLALRQAAGVQEALADRRYEVELLEVETRGDRVRDELIHRLGKTGAFVRTLDERVLAGDADGAVHSLKDMPTELPPDLVVAGVPERAAPNDVLVTPAGGTLSDLPEGAVVGTGSLRRTAQLLAARPDLDVRPIRGNVDTRLEKLLAPELQREHERRLDAAADERGNAAEAEIAGEEYDREYERTPEAWFDDLAELERRALGRDSDEAFDALVLAEAGLARSGLLHHVSYERLPTNRFVPAAGQGALAVVARGGSDAAEAIHAVVDHPRTRVETTVERTVLAGVGGGCIAPVGIHAVVQGSYVHVTARVLSTDGTTTVEGSRDLPIEEHARAAREFADALGERGAAELIEEARREADTADDDAARVDE